MHRSGLIAHNIRKEVRRIDFFLEPHLKDPEHLSQSIEDAVQLLAAPSKLSSKIAYAHSGGKSVARATDHASTIALRMLNRGLHDKHRVPGNRDDIVLALKAVISEQVPFLIIKLDVKSFYESFTADYVLNHLVGSRTISSSTRIAIKSIIDNHVVLGNSGLPRGLVISPTLADSMMREFDAQLHSNPKVFFYRRFVDDIVVIMNSGANSSVSISEFETVLPNGLQFKETKKTVLAFEKCKPKENATGKATKFLSFNYLGYAFHCANADHNYRADQTRDVWLDIAESKITRTKTRLMKSYVDFIRTSDFDLLERRVRHLTSNISLRDRSKGITRLSGIHFNYPLIDLERSKALPELDRFLRNTLHSTKGRIFSKLSSKLSSSQRAQLLRHSFYSGARFKRFYQFNPKELARIQRCWKHE
ncbi:hypothetical protein C1929_13250 [Stenotrophomonas sp. ZAC14D1_NAIMI4_6]|uniref:antiviral reverse transcriptase Drt3a n=1 Tax=unclassified Stenotrophomonas maltophilia group TaxID=2961925 RepID=UPI000D53DC06|nr:MULTISPECIES: antiviral reverse transcriptase Drt3a [unclassified Stenotrophomonas maltophilia group]AWH37644.1 hypothetical protein C1929_13250 [Stenotrophomonas sp. ZAC14D1_NAIMI4_6]AWH41778.1 hypothetical protein C1927_13260 [Stenotrophomonas sp. ZAC14D1_NAIMI4_1]